MIREWHLLGIMASAYGRVMAFAMARCSEPPMDYEGSASYHRLYH